MDDLTWCKNNKNGIKLISPNLDLCKEYMDSAEETLSLLKDVQTKSKMWAATTKYYCEYFAVYSLMMKLGIKSEIHDCTIKLSKFLEEEGLLPKGTYDLLEYDKQLRIDNQYYLKNRKVEIGPNEIRNFILTLKDKINSLTLDEITSIREKITKVSF